MTITIDGAEYQCVSLNVKRELRRTDINYNTQGDMLIDLVRRKYLLEVNFGLLTEGEAGSLRESCERIFVSVGFEAPEGRVEREFHVMNEPAFELTTVNGVKMYSGIRLVFKEK